MDDAAGLSAVLFGAAGFVGLVWFVKVFVLPGRPPAGYDAYPDDDD